MSKLRFGAIDPLAALAALSRRELNYDRAEVRRPEWNIDVHRIAIADEVPGPPMPGGPWEVACELVRDYEFTPSGLVHAVFDRSSPLLGRDLLLEARFAMLRFVMGVRITSLVEESGGDRDIWGWGYETLQGHLERGEVVYRVIKYRDSGRVEFTASSHSQADPQLGLILRTGWYLFGRCSQLRFYREIGRRITRLVRERPAHRTGGGAPAGDTTGGADLVRVPSLAHRHALDRVALYSYDPVRSRLRSG
jgi:hypothetical protein